MVRFDHLTAHHLISVLPRVMVVEASGSTHSEWMQSTLRLLAFEARQMRPGAQAVVSRLADILVIQAIRAWIEQEPAAQGGWLGALKDRQIGRALALVHRDPARDWALGSLAAEVGLSRSAFAARFTQLVGLPPMQYLGRWRMHVALARLQEHDDGPGRPGGPRGLPVRSGVQPRVQAPHGCRAGRHPEERDAVIALSAAATGSALRAALAHPADHPQPADDAQRRRRLLRQAHPVRVPQQQRGGAEQGHEEARRGPLCGG